MSSRVLSASLAATVFACGVALSAQQSQPPASPMAAQSQATSFKVVGCVQNERDVLKSSMPGKPGMGDEFVLTNAVLKADATPTETPQAQPSEPTSAYGTQNRFGKVYRATGDRESELKGYVGQRVEITGSFKHSEDATRELGATGTSGRAAAAEPSVENTPEITIASIAPLGGTCSPVAK